MMTLRFCLLLSTFILAGDHHARAFQHDTRRQDTKQLTTNTEGQMTNLLDVLTIYRSVVSLAPSDTALLKCCDTASVTPHLDLVMIFARHVNAWLKYASVSLYNMMSDPTVIPPCLPEANSHGASHGGHTGRGPPSPPPSPPHPPPSGPPPPAVPKGKEYPVYTTFTRHFPPDDRHRRPKRQRTLRDRRRRSRRKRRQRKLREKRERKTEVITALGSMSMMGEQQEISPAVWLITGTALGFAVAVFWSISHRHNSDPYHLDSAGDFSRELVNAIADCFRETEHGRQHRRPRNQIVDDMYDRNESLTRRRRKERRRTKKGTKRRRLDSSSQTGSQTVAISSESSVQSHTGGRSVKHSSSLVSVDDRDGRLRSGDSAVTLPHRIKKKGRPRGRGRGHKRRRKRSSTRRGGHGAWDLLETEPLSWRLDFESSDRNSPPLMVTASESTPTSGERLPPIIDHVLPGTVHWEDSDDYSEAHSVGRLGSASQSTCSSLRDEFAGPWVSTSLSFVVYDLDCVDDIPDEVLEVLSCDRKPCEIHHHDRYHYVGSKIIVQRLPLPPGTIEQVTSATYLPNLHICTSPYAEDTVTISQERNVCTCVPTPKKHVRIAEENICISVNMESQEVPAEPENAGKSPEVPAESETVQPAETPPAPSVPLASPALVSSAVNTEQTDVADSSIQTVAEADENPPSTPIATREDGITVATNTDHLECADSSMQVSYKMEDLGADTGVNTEHQDLADRSMQLSFNCDDVGVNTSESLAGVSPKVELTYMDEGVNTSLSLTNASSQTSLVAEMVAAGVNTDLVETPHTEDVCINTSHLDLADVYQQTTGAEFLTSTAINTDQVDVVDSATSPEVQEDVAREEIVRPQQNTSASQTDDVEFKQYGGHDMSSQTSADLTDLQENFNQDNDPASTSGEHLPVIFPLPIRTPKLCVPAAKAASAGFHDHCSAASSPNRLKGSSAVDILMETYERCVRNPYEDVYEAWGHYNSAAFDNNYKQQLGCPPSPVRRETRSPVRNTPAGDQPNTTCSTRSPVKFALETIKGVYDHCMKETTLDPSGTSTDISANPCIHPENSAHRSKSREPYNNVKANNQEKHTSVKQCGDRNAKKALSNAGKETTKQHKKEKTSQKTSASEICQPCTTTKVKSICEDKKATTQCKTDITNRNAAPSEVCKPIKPTKVKSICPDREITTQRKTEMTNRNDAASEICKPCTTTKVKSICQGKETTQRKTEITNRNDAASEICKPCTTTKVTSICQDKQTTQRKPEITGRNAAASEICKPCTTTKVKSICQDKETTMQRKKEVSQKESCDKLGKDCSVQDRSQLFRELKETVAKRQPSRYSEKEQTTSPRCMHPVNEEMTSEGLPSKSAQRGPSPNQKETTKSPRPQRICIIPQQTDTSSPPQKICFQTKQEDGSLSTQKICILPQQKDGSKSQQKVCIIPQQTTKGPSSEKPCISQSQKECTSCSLTVSTVPVHDAESPKRRRKDTVKTHETQKPSPESSTASPSSKTGGFEQKMFAKCSGVQSEIEQNAAHTLPVFSPGSENKQSGETSIHSPTVSRRRSWGNISQVFEDKRNRSLKSRKPKEKPVVKIQNNIKEIYDKCMEGNSKKRSITQSDANSIASQNKRIDYGRYEGQTLMGSLTDTKSIAEKHTPASQLSQRESESASVPEGQTITHKHCLTKTRKPDQSQDNDSQPLTLLPLAFPFVSKSGGPGAYPPQDQDSSNSAEKGSSEMLLARSVRQSSPNFDKKEPYQSLSKATVKEPSPPWEVSDRAKNNVFSPVGWTSPRSGITSLFRGQSNEQMDALGNSPTVPTNDNSFQSFEESDSQSKSRESCTNDIQKDATNSEDSIMDRTRSKATIQSSTGVSVQQTSGYKSWESSTDEDYSKEMCSSIKIKSQIAEHKETMKEKHYCVLHPDMVELSKFRASTGTINSKHAKQCAPSFPEHKPRIISGAKRPKRSLSPGRRMLALSSDALPSKPKHSQFMNASDRSMDSALAGHVLKRPMVADKEASKEKAETHSSETKSAYLREKDEIQSGRAIGKPYHDNEEGISNKEKIKGNAAQSYSQDPSLVRSLSGKYQLCKNTNDINEELKKKLTESRRPSQIRRGKRKTDGNTSVHCENVRSQIPSKAGDDIFSDSHSESSQWSDSTPSQSVNTKDITSYAICGADTTQTEYRSQSKTMSECSDTMNDLNSEMDWILPSASPITSQSKLPVSTNSKYAKCKLIPNGLSTDGTDKHTTVSRELKSIQTKPNARLSRIPVARASRENLGVMQPSVTKAQLEVRSMTSFSSDTGSLSGSMSSLATHVDSCTSKTVRRSEVKPHPHATTRRIQNAFDPRSNKNAPSKLPLPVPITGNESCHLSSLVKLETKAVSPMIATRIKQLQQSASEKQTTNPRDVQHIRKLSSYIDDEDDEVDELNKLDNARVATESESPSFYPESRATGPAQRNRMRQTVCHSSPKNSLAIEASMLTENDTTTAEGTKKYTFSFEAESNIPSLNTEGNISQNHNGTDLKFGSYYIDTEVSLSLDGSYSDTSNLSVIQGLVDVDDLNGDEVNVTRSDPVDAASSVPSTDLESFSMVTTLPGITEEIKYLMTMNGGQIYPSQVRRIGITQQEKGARKSSAVYTDITDQQKSNLQHSTILTDSNEICKPSDKALKRSQSVSNLPSTCTYFKHVQRSNSMMSLQYDMVAVGISEAGMFDKVEESSFLSDHYTSLDERNTTTALTMIGFPQANSSFIDDCADMKDFPQRIFHTAMSEATLRSQHDNSCDILSVNCRRNGSKTIGDGGLNQPRLSSVSEMNKNNATQPHHWDDIRELSDIPITGSSDVMSAFSSPGPKKDFRTEPQAVHVDLEGDKVRHMLIDVGHGLRFYEHCSPLNLELVKITQTRTNRVSASGDNLAQSPEKLAASGSNKQNASI